MPTLRETAQQIKSKITCIDVAQLCGLPITKSGGRCPSPFHAGSNPTAMIVCDTFWYSHSDNFGGDCIDLYAELKCNSNRGKAINDLAERYGINTEPDMNYGWEAKTQNLCNQIQYWHTQLRDSDREYLHSRNISDDTINRLKIGYNGFDGISVPYFKNGYVYDYILRNCTKTPRYERMPQSDSSDPWGLHTLNRSGDIYLCEGTFDGIALDQAGVSVLVDTRPQLDRLINRSVVLCYDNDDTGAKYTTAVSRMLIRNGINFRIAVLPAGCKDVSEFFASNPFSSLTYSDGTAYIVSLIKSQSDAYKYIDRKTDPVVIASIINQTALDDKTKQKLTAILTQPPMESVIADEIIAENTIIYIDQVGFYIYNSTVWLKQSDNTIRNLVDKTIGKTHSTAHKINATLNILKARVLSPIVFDRKPIIVFPNGTLELDTGIFRNSRQTDYASIVMDYPYKPDAHCPRWLDFIDTVMESDPIKTELLQFIAGYVLFPNCKHQKLFALIGNGGNGKSVYLDILKKLYGEKNCTNLEPNDFTEDFKCILSKDSLLNVASEIDSDFSKSEKIMKKVAAGETVTACYKGQTHIDFNPRCKLIFACNEMPRASIIKGIDRRIIFINFPLKFVETPSEPNERRRDIDLISKLTEELSGIFNWAYEGYLTLNKVGYFTESEEQEILMEQFKESSNHVLLFCKDFEPTDRVMRTDVVYECYRDWCRDNGYQPYVSQTFKMKYADEGFKKNRKIINGRRLWVYEYVAIN